MHPVAEKLKRLAAIQADPNGLEATLAIEAADALVDQQRLLMRLRPYVAELATFSSAAARHRDLTDEIDAMLGYSSSPTPAKES